MAVDDGALGLRVREARTTAGRSAQSVADAAGMDQAAYSRGESGKRPFRAVELMRIAEALDLTLDQMVWGMAPPDVVAVRKAQAAGEAAVAAVAEWVAAVGRALTVVEDRPEVITAKLADPEARLQLIQQMVTFIDGTLPRPRSAAVPAGTTPVFDHVLRGELPRRIIPVDGAPMRGAEDEQQTRDASGAP